MPNLYGDILSDVAAQIAGSVGLAGSANIGERCAMFEAIHGSAPRRAGQNLANPSGLLLAAVMMLVHIDQPDVATRVHNAWLRTIEDGIHTYDIFVEGVSKQKVGTKEFAAAVVARLGQQPEKLKAVKYASSPKKAIEKKQTPAQLQVKKDLVGVDVFLDWKLGTADDLGKALQAVNGENLELTLITNRGAKVWPNGQPETFTTDHWRCRFLSQQGTITHGQITSLLERIANRGLDFIKIENLYNFDGQSGYSSVSGA
jgi:isocitrate dehydrogenase